VGTRAAERGTDVVAGWATNPGSVSLALQKVTCDGVTGHIMAVIANSSGGTLTLPNPTTLSIVYQPRSTP